MKIGILYGISVGTGEPELITLKGLRYLQQAEVVAFPAGVNNQLGMAESIVSSWLKPQQKKLALQFPYVQDELVLQAAWELAAEKVWQYLKIGQNVAFVCEGDVSFYSTFNYLAQSLRTKYPQTFIEMIPGVSSPMAAAAALGIPLTIQSQKLAVLPALYSVAELESVLLWADVVVLMKVSSVYQQVWHILAKHNLLKQSSIVERATLPNQIVYSDLSDRDLLKLSYFSILIISKIPR